MIFSTVRKLMFHAPVLIKRSNLYPELAKGFFNTLVLRRDIMRYLEVQINTECNSKCLMCYATGMRKDGEHYLSVEEIKNFYRELRRGGVISGIITGGEPSLRKDLIEILEALEARKNLFAMTTNSISMNRRLLKELYNAGLCQINLSLNSLDPQQNDLERGYSGHFEKVMEVIAWSQEIGIPVGLSVLVTHQNIRIIEDFLKFCSDKKVQFCPAWAISRGRWAGRHDVGLTGEDWRYLHKINRKYRCMRMDISTNYSCRTDCPGAKEKMYITAYGDVSTCQLNPVSFGSIRKEPLGTIIDRMRAIPSFKRINPYCVVSSDEEYVNDYIYPIADVTRLPVDIKDHPIMRKKGTPAEANSGK